MARRGATATTGAGDGDGDAARALPRATDRRLVADRLYEQALLALLVAEGHLRPSPA